LALAAGSSLTSPSVNVANGGTLTVASGATLSSFTGLTVSGNATLNGATQTLASLDGANTGILTLNGTALNVGGTSTYSGKITGSGSVTKNTAGTLTLAGQANDFTGGLTVSGPGAVILGGTTAGNSNPGGTQPVTVNSNGKLVLGGAAGVNITSNVVLDGGTLGSTGAAQALKGTLTINSASTLSSFNPITGASPVDLNLDGQLIAPTNPNITITNANGNLPETAAVRFRGPASTYAGTITVAGSAAKFELLTAAATGSPIGTATVVFPAGNFTNATNQGTFGIVNLRNNFVSVPAGTPTTATLGNNFQITGSGFVLMNMLGNAAAQSTTVLGDLQIGNNQTVAATSTASAIFNLQFNSVHLTGGTATFAAGLTGNTNYVIADNFVLGPISENVLGSGINTSGTGKVTMTGANTYTGPTNVQGGTLILGAGSSISSSSAVTIASAAKIDATALPTVNVLSGHSLTVNGVFDTNAGGFTPGTLALSGTLSGSGDGFSNGVVKATLVAGSGSTVSPGVSGPGVLAGQNLDLQACSNFVVDLAKATPGAHPNAGTDYDQFTAVDFSGGALSTVHLAGNLTINVGSGLQTGDVFTLILNQSFDAISGTFNGLPDGAVFSAGGQFFQISYGDDSSTLDVMEFNLGNEVSLQVVPEPTTALLLLGGFAPVVLRRKRRS
jgi:autotransporter-associated beta strand protein